MPLSRAPAIGLVKFFSKRDYLDDFLGGSLYCNTPQFYRDSDAPGVSDDFEACIAYSNLTKHPTPPPNVVINGKPLNLFGAESLIVYGDADQYDAHLQCWFAAEHPKDFESGIPALRSDIDRVRRESGPFSVFLPASNIKAYLRLLEDATPDGFTGSLIQYTDDPKIRGMFRKRISFAYQREYRFAIGRVDKGYLPYRRLRTSSPLDHLVEVCPKLSVRNGNKTICILPQLEAKQ